jgi:hypothetical protein
LPGGLARCRQRPWLCRNREHRDECQTSAMRLLPVAAGTLVVLFAGAVFERTDTSAGASPKATGKTFHFKSPTGNIQCRMNAEAVSCLLRVNRWRRLKPRPADCDVDWFPTDMTMFLDPRSGRWRVGIGGCRGDIGPLCYQGDPCFVLRYGRSVSSTVNPTGPRGLRCTSSPTKGITCAKIGRKPGVHGFRIARQGYAVF